MLEKLILILKLVHIVQFGADSGTQSVNVGVTIVGIKRVDSSNENITHSVWFSGTTLYWSRGGDNGNLTLTITYLYL